MYPAQNDSAYEPHPAIAPLSFLLGRWQGAGVLGYPTIQSANYREEISFSHNGKPFLIYSSRAWLLEEDGTIGRPSHMEVGFWRPQPDGVLEVLITHPTGVTEIYIGTIAGTKIEMATDAVARTASAKPITNGATVMTPKASDANQCCQMLQIGAVGL